MKILINNKEYSLSPPINSGGEGEIYVHPFNKDEVIKIYFDKRKNKEKLIKLKSLSDEFVKPIEIFEQNGKVIGFSMKYVEFNKYFLLNKLFNKAFCQSNQIDLNFKISLFKKLKESIEKVHNKGFVLGDINQYNIFFNLKGEYYIVDVDSFQEEGKIVSDVVLEDIRDFFTNTINKNSDIWAYTILLFWSFTYVHPFRWVLKGAVQNLEERVKKNLSYLSHIPNIIIPPLYQKLPLDIENQIKEIFKGRRFFVNFDIPVQQIPVIIKQQLISSKVNNTFISDGNDVVFCENKFAIRIGNKWKIYNNNYSFIEIEAEKVFVSNNNYCYIKNSILYNSKNEEVLDISSYSIHFNNGYLFVLGIDEYWVFNINNQLYKIENNKKIIYSKSVLISNSIIQNFGNKTILNKLNKMDLLQIEVMKSVKNAIVNGEYIAIEYEENNKIVYAMFKINGMKIEKLFYISHLPNFTVKDNIIFIPNNREILVYNQSVLIETIDVSICTEQSVLHINSFGVLIFENNSLNCLNKK